MKSSSTHINPFLDLVGPAVIDEYQAPRFNSSYSIVSVDLFNQAVQKFCTIHGAACREFYELLSSREQEVWLLRGEEKKRRAETASKLSVTHPRVAQLESTIFRKMIRFSLESGFLEI